MIKFRKSYEVGFGDVDFTGKMTINALIHYMQDIAAVHATHLGLSFYKNVEKPLYYWIICRVKINIETYPNWEEELVIETYPRGYDKLFAVRQFDLYDKNKNKIGDITGYYLLMETNTKRPFKIKGAEPPFNVLDFPYSGEDLPKILPTVDILQKQNRVARYSQMDLNQHMNNSYHIQWVLDCLPINWIKENTIKQLQLNYTSAVKYNTQVEVCVGIETENTAIIWGQSQDGKTTYFTARLVFEQSLCL